MHLGYAHHLHPLAYFLRLTFPATTSRFMLQQRRARVAAVAASAAAIFLISLTILDIRNPLETLGFLYRHVYPGVGYSRSASTTYPRAFIPRVALPLCPRTTDLHFPIDIGSDYSGGVGLQRPTVLAPISRQPLVWSAVISPFENQQSCVPCFFLSTGVLFLMLSLQVPTHQRRGDVLRWARGGAGQATASPLTPHLARRLNPPPPPLAASDCTLRWI